MPRIRLLIEQFEIFFKVENYKKHLFYVGFILSLIYNLYSLQLRGYPVGLLFFNQSFSSSTSQHSDIFWQQYFYQLTGIRAKEPISFLAYALPERDSDVQLKSYTDIKGYFSNMSELYTLTNNTTSEIDKAPSEIASVDLVEAFKDPSYVLNRYLVGGEMELDVDMIEEFKFDELIQQPIRLNESIEGPQVLIFHTHSREEYVGELTVIDIADAFKKELEEVYGISVLHITDSFYEDSNNGNRPTSGEYERMEIRIEEVLKENPSISVVIDMHRDGVKENVHLVTEIDGKSTARVMFVAPLCRHRNVAGEVVKKVDLPNPYIADNLAFALQMYIQGEDDYPGFFRKTYCREWRFSTHMAPQSLLVEWGAQTNTDEEALNAVAPMARILAKVLQKD